MADIGSLGDATLTAVGSVVTGAIIVLLGILKHLGNNREKALIAKAVIKDTPITQMDLTNLELRLSITLMEGFNSARKEFMTEVGKLHEKLNDHTH